MIDNPEPMDYAALSAFQEQLRWTVSSTTQCMREAGLEPVTFLLLLTLRQQPAGTPMTIGSLAEALRSDRSEIVELLDELVRRGFVARERDRSDRRRFLISLTPAGAQWLAPLAKSVLRELVATGPELLRAVRTVVAHAASSAARVQPAPRADISDFAWRAVGSAPI